MIIGFPSRQSLIRFTIGSIRFWLGLIFLTSGLAKLTHNTFPNTMGPPFLEDELAKYGLGMYARFIAFSQVTIGFLLISKRFATLGAVMAMPMLVNILVVVISLKWQGTPYVVGFFLFCTILLLIYDFHKLKFILSDNPAPLMNHPIERNDWRLDLGNGVAFIILLTGAMLWPVSELISMYLINLGIVLLIGLGIVAVVLHWRQNKVHNTLASEVPL
ncbi:DoxX family membrane protein [Cytophagaceae bacterium DM2B3-1]|uniref:DoxX family membrane protein n=1 Tax=Xanthocytophaga flava TaxID=3048013 RepID=A0ABT7CLI2_9BACT|nr:DoxX family membrane protein [Xanthocytophaga flavus]MDJ1469879.1 DoxX family membrane protein [Xanthocytophaga flavus]MDJ1494391.1 DoxX family membrane protein [Xanthocytophaga flavus]